MSDIQAETMIAEITDNPYSDPAIYEAAVAFSAQIGMPQKGIEMGIMLAGNARKKGNLEEAKQMYGAMLLMAPQNIEAMIGLAQCLIEADENEQAFLLSSAILLSDYFRSDGHILSAKANTMMGRFDEAEADLNRVLELAQQKGDGRLELIVGKLIRENRKAEESALAEAAEDDIAANEAGEES